MIDGSIRIETAEGSSIYELSAAYDMLSTNIVIPDDKEQLALTLNGKKQNIRRKDFFIFAASLGITEKSAAKMLGKIISLKDKYLALCRESYMPDCRKAALAELIAQRISVLDK